MRNLGIFLAIAGIAFACSSDDGGTTPPPPPDTEDFSAYINSGGPALSAGGNNFVADDNNQYNDASDTYASVNPDLEIDGTEDDALYRTEVFDVDVFTYNIAVPGEATLEVKLHFAEIYHGVQPNTDGIEGERVFDINIEGTAIDNYDIIAEAGATATAVIETIPDISVTDGSLTITFTAVIDAAKVSAIEVSGTYIVP